ncbi:biotin-dependent carboxyltransferase family protein [Mycetohabitans sp. B8]|uniref:5-oxoprolinase subunit C family protein n=1 Tax=Mycetohabitans sp. B8 TaxID=2841845 RepID=UPI001F42773C|nr:biotin-dependent carboxyltransferase family protein [Mycetohabitans sp. B8]MCG1043565.1 biotin-dependent carboxyltransferase family protein [Mycetohabitans sp. B8]
MIEVIRAGTLTTVQDLGRTGHRQYGVCTAGALDTVALQVANRLVGNVPGAAGLELTLGPVVLRFPRATRIALTGADFHAMLDDQPVYAWRSLPVQAGQTLTLRAPSIGMRGYLTIAGGIDVMPMLGSRSTDLGSHFGGLAGRALKDGDRLPVAPLPASARNPAFSPKAPAFGVKPPSWCALEHLEQGAGHRLGAIAARVRVIPGPEYASFSTQAHAAFWNEDWAITPNSNRMGFRLAGPVLERQSPIDLLSHGVLPGTIQVPPNGQPIVLMSDAQTTGGYPRFGSVIAADLWLLAQARLNQRVHFIQCSLEQARNALVELNKYLRHIELAIALQQERCKAAA